MRCGVTSSRPRSITNRSRLAKRSARANRRRRLGTAGATSSERSATTICERRRAKIGVTWSTACHATGLARWLQRGEAGGIDRQRRTPVTNVPDRGEGRRARARPQPCRALHERGSARPVRSPIGRRGRPERRWPRRGSRCSDAAPRPPRFRRSSSRARAGGTSMEGPGDGNASALPRPVAAREDDVPSNCPLVSRREAAGVPSRRSAKLKGLARTPVRMRL